jgi:hypothetical protein
MTSPTQRLHHSQHSSYGIKLSNRKLPISHFSSKPLRFPDVEQCRIKHDLVAELVDALKQQANMYFFAIKKSVETAQDGVTLAEDAQKLCDILTSGNHTIHDLKAFINDMIEIASKAHRESVATMELFSKIRISLLEV